MLERVLCFIKGCSLCVVSKPSKRNLGLYTPLPIPSHPWESVFMDFVGCLPLSKLGHDYFYVVVDSFIKMCILMPCKNKITDEKTTHLFFQHVWVHFGFPISIVSDRYYLFDGNYGQVCGT